MPYVDNKGIRIYYEVDGNGTPLVLQHGSASSLQTWRQCGYVEELKNDFQCILIDARGRGKSDKPHVGEAYTLRSHVSDVVAVLDELQIRSAHYWGYSMGGWIGFGMAQFAPERLRALIIGGAHPYEDRSFAAFERVDGSDPDAFIAAFEAALHERMSPERRPYVLANDLRALAASMQIRSSMEAVLPTIRVPSLLYVGEADNRHAAVKSCVGHIPGGRIATLPGLNHSEVMLRSDLVLAHVIKFLVGAAKN